MIKNISKYIIIFFCTVLINSANINSSYADDHTPKRKLINELKKEITELGETPVKRKHLFSSLQKWIDELEVQLAKLKKIEALKAELNKELEALGEKPLSKEEKELEADEEIIALRKQIEEVKNKNKLAEDKKKKEQKIAVAIEMLKDELIKLGEDPVIDTSEIDTDETIKALKKQIKEAKERKEKEKAEKAKKIEKEKIEEEKKQTRLKAIEGVKKEILFMGETPLSEYEFTSEDQYIAALRKQVEELKKIKEEEEFKINAEIPDWYQSPPSSSETIMYSRGNGISSDLDNSEEQNDIPSNFTIFSASQLDQISSGLSEAKHGIFSYYLMKGLEGKADNNNDRKITNGELLAYMIENVSQKAAELGREQIPSLKGNPNEVLSRY